MFQRSAWSPTNFEVELPAPGKPQNQQEGVQGKKTPESKKRSLKLVALTVDH